MASFPPSRQRRSFVPGWGAHPMQKRGFYLEFGVPHAHLAQHVRRGPRLSRLWSRLRLWPAEQRRTCPQPAWPPRGPVWVDPCVTRKGQCGLWAQLVPGCGDVDKKKGVLLKKSVPESFANKLSWFLSEKPLMCVFSHADGCVGSIPEHLAPVGCHREPVMLWVGGGVVTQWC